MFTYSRFTAKFIFLSGLIALQLFCVSAQEYVVRKITTADGLPSDFINHFFQDKDGYMWISTDKGASRFDGHRFQKFTVDNGLYSNFTNAVHQDRTGQLWMTSFSDSALTLFAPPSIQHFQIIPRGIKRLYFDSRNRLYAGGIGRFYCMQSVLPVPEAANFYVTGSQLSPDSFLLLYPDRFLLLDVHKLNHPKVSALPFDTTVSHGYMLNHKGKVYVFGHHALILLDASKPWPWPVTTVAKGHFSCYSAVVTDSSILMATQKGLWEFTFHSKSLKKVNDLFGLPDIGVNELYIDRQGSLWIGTHGYGLVVCPKRPVFITENADERIVKIAGNNREILVVGSSAFYRYSNHALQPIATNPFYQYSGVYYQKNQWWLSDYQFLFGPTSTPEALMGRPVINVPNGIASFCIAADHTEYIATYADGIIRRREGRILDTITVSKGLCANTIENLFPLATGIAAVSYSNGFSIIAPNGKLQNFSKKDGLLSNMVYAVASRGDTLIVGVEGGISVFVNGKWLFNFTQNNGLVGTRVLGFFTDRQNRNFFFTEKCMHQLKDNAVFPLRSVKILPREKGIIHCFFYQPQRNMLYVGTSHGIAELSMDQVIQDTVLPPLQLSHIFSNKQTLAFTHVHLPAHEHSITYRFIAQSFLYGASPEIYCRLAGADTAFVLLPQNFEQQYVNLPPGRYKFLAYVRNADGVQSPVRELHTFTIRQLWWKSTGFIVLAVLALSAGLSWAVWRFQQKRYKQKMNILQLKAEQQVQRERIRRDLHDNIGSQLSYMASQIDWINARQDQMPDHQKIALLASLGEGTREILGELRESMWSLKYNAITMPLLVERMQQIVQKMQGMGQQPVVDFKVHTESSLVLNPHSALNMLRIFQEALSNAWKHAGATRIAVDFGMQADGSLVLSIMDNGVGFEKEKVDTGEHYGLENMERRAMDAGFKLEINGTPGQGTLVRVSALPEK